MAFYINEKALHTSTDCIENDSWMVSSVPKSYQVQWDSTSNPCETINAVLLENSKNVLLIDEKVFELYGKDIQHPANKILKVPATEEYKTLEGVKQLCDFLYEQDFTKAETLVVVGGGIIQDVGAFVGATYKRGINWEHFPTTLLAMTDSCIGGKAGINYQGFKNQLALFSAPRAVIINPNFLDTLAVQDIQSGLGEILKLYIIGGRSLLTQYQQWTIQNQTINKAHVKSLILNALSVKRAVIEEDEFELNIRKALNYGHTFGHAIESMSNYTIPHGIAVVVGMMLVNFLAYKQDLLAQEDCFLVNHLCKSLLNDSVLLRLKALDMYAMLQQLKQDKKVVGDSVTLIMLTSPGNVQLIKVKLDEQLFDQIKEGFAHCFM